MDRDQIIATLLAEHEKLVKENDHLKWTLSLVKENEDLRGRVTLNIEDLTAGSPSGTHSAGLLQTFNEQNFRQHLEQTNVKHDHRTSSPVDFKSFIQSSMHTNADNRAEVQSCQPASFCPEAQVASRLLGEIVYQLDRRILSYVFQGHTRLFGFTLSNIPGKIVEVSTHPLTGNVDEDYRCHLTHRHADLMLQLNQFGYKAALHPTFIEFIVNTYGILTKKPDKHSKQETDYNNPGFLKELVTATAPEKLQKDLLLLLTCLCYMAENDRRPLILW